ncbi:MAG: hypothetical protein IKJ24_02570 [Clostridia bacterium]|nr:hypothetical protein [Clostridia bacterium]
MGFFKRSFQKNVTRNNEFLKDYAIKCNGLSLYVEENEKVQKELNALKDDFQYTVATNIRDAKSVEKKIKKDFDALTLLLQQDGWDEKEVLLLIRGLRRYIIEISSMR